ncbi:MAG TPA: hypothetical protein VKB58_06045, partial [Terriglobales bacterium]|nr:hypothetical protein [Terriglobales bacterium]
CAMRLLEAIDEILCLGAHLQFWVFGRQKPDFSAEFPQLGCLLIVRGHRREQENGGIKSDQSERNHGPAPGLHVLVLDRKDDHAATPNEQKSDFAGDSLCPDSLGLGEGH